MQQGLGVRLDACLSSLPTSRRRTGPCVGHPGRWRRRHGGAVRRREPRGFAGSRHGCPAASRRRHARTGDDARCPGRSRRGIRPARPDEERDRGRRLPCARRAGPGVARLVALRPSSACRPRRWQSCRSAPRCPTSRRRRAGRRRASNDVQNVVRRAGRPCRCRVGARGRTVEQVRQVRRAPTFSTAARGGPAPPGHQLGPARFQHREPRNDRSRS